MESLSYAVDHKKQQNSWALRPPREYKFSKKRQKNPVDKKPNAEHPSTQTSVYGHSIQERKWS